MSRLCSLSWNAQVRDSLGRCLYFPTYPKLTADPGLLSGTVAVTSQPSVLLATELWSSLWKVSSVDKPGTACQHQYQHHPASGTNPELHSEVFHGHLWWIMNAWIHKHRDGYMDAEGDGTVIPLYLVTSFLTLPLILTY